MTSLRLHPSSIQKHIYSWANSCAFWIEIGSLNASLALVIKANVMQSKLCFMASVEILKAGRSVKLSDLAMCNYWFDVETKNTYKAVMSKALMKKMKNDSPVTALAILRSDSRAKVRRCRD